MLLPRAAPRCGRIAGTGAASPSAVGETELRRGARGAWLAASGQAASAPRRPGQATGDTSTPRMCEQKRGAGGRSAIRAFQRDHSLLQNFQSAGSVRTFKAAASAWPRGPRIACGTVAHRADAELCHAGPVCSNPVLAFLLVGGDRSPRSHAEKRICTF